MFIIIKKTQFPDRSNRSKQFVFIVVDRQVRPHRIPLESEPPDRPERSKQLVFRVIKKKKKCIYRPHGIPLQPGHPDLYKKPPTTN